MSHEARFGLVVAGLILYGVAANAIARLCGAEDGDRKFITFLAYPVGVILVLICEILWDLSR